MKLTKREYIFIIFAAIIISISLYYSLFYIPLILETEKIQDSINKACVRLDEINKKRKMFEDYDLKIETYELQLSQKQELIPSDVDEPGIVFLLEDVTEGRGKKSSIIFDKTEEHDNYKVLKVILTMETSYSNLKLIMKDLELASLPCIIERLYAENLRQDAVQEYHISVDMTLVFYYNDGGDTVNRDYPTFGGSFGKTDIFR